VGARLAVVVVLHDSAATLRACLHSVLAQPEVDELVLVDNASRDGWQAEVPEDPRVRRMHNAENVGFAVACNQGATASEAPWLLFLNPDCELPSGALGTLLAVAEGQGTPGLLGAQLLESDGRPQPASRRLDPTPRRLLRGRLELPAPPWRDQTDAAPAFERLEAISGALMLMPRSLFADLGGFDEGYRLHCEDLDLCRRVRLRGAWVGIAPRVQVLHHKGTSSRRRPFWVELQKHRGMWRYFQKFDAHTASRWTRAVIAIGLCLRYPLAALRSAWRARAQGRAE
jgi:GT2 family glycosyltransferase